MDRIPEVYEDARLLKEQLIHSDEAVVYSTPESAQWLVDKEYEPNLTVGEAVRIEKRMDGFLIVPVKWDRSPETDLWDWVEVEQPFIGEIDLESRFDLDEEE